MAQDPDNQMDLALAEEVERQTLREAMDAQQALMLLEQERVERAARRKRREERVQEHRERQKTQVREMHARRLKALQEAEERATAHLGAASRSLRAALRAITETTAPRHTPQGQQQQRFVRFLQEAMGAVRRAGGADFHETDIDLGTELDAL